MFSRPIIEQNPYSYSDSRTWTYLSYAHVSLGIRGWNLPNRYDNTKNPLSYLSYNFFPSPQSLPPPTAQEANDRGFALLFGGHAGGELLVYERPVHAPSATHRSGIDRHQPIASYERRDLLIDFEHLLSPAEPHVVCEVGET